MSHLRYYLRLGEDDRRSVLENRPLSRHLATWKKELSKISAVHFEHLATLLYQGVEGGLEDVALIEVISVVTGVSIIHAWRAWSSQFSNKVTKMCCHTKQIETRSSCLKLQKLDGPVWQTGLSYFVGTDDSQVYHRALTRCSSSDQVMSRRWRGVNHNNFGGCGGG
jgi:hypothetical protein